MSGAMTKHAPPPGKIGRMIRFALGVLLILIAPIVGIIPGPGGIPVFAAGLVLVLQSSSWAPRRFVVVKRRWPRFGHLADIALRRRSARRRRERAKALAR